MQGPAHLALSWFVGEACGLDEARDRRIVGLAGLAPDADALAYVGAYVVFGFDIDRAYREVWVSVHHYYTHGVGFALATGLVAWAFASKSRGPASRAAIKVAGLAFLVSLTHVFCDVVAAGPRFPVYPWWPLSDLGWTASWSWELRDWPNQVITFGAIAATLVYARLAGRSPIESFSYALDRSVVRIVREGSTRGGSETGDGDPSRSRREARTRWIVYVILAVATTALVIPIWSELF